ncbi:MAG: hypothetical protein NC548_40220 [Lachnospiraceae bacterium]|nr:hypothetical protein [Lachnospiraceae bacterium]
MKKSVPNHKDLICVSYIFNSHEDFSVVEDIYAGFDKDFNFLILCEHTDYDDSRYNSATCAVLSKEEAYRLAKRLKVSLSDLPLAITESMSEWNEIPCPLPKDVRACFKEITDCLIDEGSRFIIKIKPSPNGYFPC